MKLNPIFCSHMVFAANQPIRFYGEGAGKAEISFAGETQTVESAGGFWLAELPPMPYGGPYTAEITLNGTLITLTDVYVGEVYLMAGQSNMQFKLKESKTPAELYRPNPRLRLFSTRRLEEGDLFTPADGWVSAEADTIGEWSAIGYLTGDILSRRKNIAVGVIACYQGASVIESWLPKGLLSQNGICLPREALHGDHLAPEFALWKQEGTLYRFALSQVSPFSLTAVAWYQGESDSSQEEGKVYTKELALLAETLRKDFRRADLPMAVICIADFAPRDDEGWHSIQRAQLQAGETIPYVTAVPCADICEKDNIHPPTKHLLAARLAEAL